MSKWRLVFNLIQSTNDNECIDGFSNTHLPFRGPPLALRGRDRESEEDDPWRPRFWPFWGEKHSASSDHPIARVATVSRSHFSPGSRKGFRAYFISRPEYLFTWFFSLDKSHHKGWISFFFLNGKIKITVQHAIVAKGFIVIIYSTEWCVLVLLILLDCMSRLLSSLITLTYINSNTAYQ